MLHCATDQTLFPHDTQQPLIRYSESKQYNIKSSLPMPALPLRVVIVKRDRMAAEFIRHAVTKAGIVAEAECCQTAAAAQQALRVCPAHLGILGLTLPDMDGIDLIAKIVAERLAFRILVISSRRDEMVRSHARLGRVDGFWDAANEDCGQLSEAIARVARGGVYFTAVPRSASEPGAVPLSELSPHELKVLAVIGDGSDDNAAAEILQLSAHTVHRHRVRIMRKLGVQTRTELMRGAIKRGVVRITPDRVLRPGAEHLFSAEKIPLGNRC